MGEGAVRPGVFALDSKKTFCCNVPMKKKYRQNLVYSLPGLFMDTDFRPNIGPDIRKPTKYLIRYPVSGQMFDRISDIRFKK